MLFCGNGAGKVERLLPWHSHFRFLCLIVAEYRDLIAPVL